MRTTFIFLILTLLSANFALATFGPETEKKWSRDNWYFRVSAPYVYKTPIADVGEPFGVVQRLADGKVNRMRLIHSGSAALYKRLEMIDRAKRSIDMEYYIFSTRKKFPAVTEARYQISTKLLVNKLIEKAIQGVKVRLLVDHRVVGFDFNEFYVAAAKARVRLAGGNPANFEVRYYHNAFSGYRNHRKLLVVDSEEAMTGGRNISDEYFDLSHRYNFLDRDIWVTGSIVPFMRASFDAFYNAPISHTPNLAKTYESQMPRRGPIREKKNRAERFVVLSDFDRKTESQIREVGSRHYNKSRTHLCPVTTFASDRPLNSMFARYCKTDMINRVFCEGNSYKEHYRNLDRALIEHMLRLQKGEELILDSPYYALNTRKGDALKELLKRNAKVHVFTNSLGSNDEAVTPSVFYREVINQVKSGIRAYVHNSKPASNYEFVNENVRKARWGMHSKTMLFGNRSFFVGTYNLDNRSSFYNSEMGLFCEGSAELNADLRSSMVERLKESSYRIVDENTVVDAYGRQADQMGGASKASQIIMYLILPFSWLIEDWL